MTTNPKPRKNSPSLTLVEELFLLVLHDEKGTIPGSKALSLKFGIGGAILAELAVLGRISLKDKKLVILDESSCGDDFLDEALEKMIKATHNRKMTYWLNTFSLNGKKIYKRLSDQLIEKKVLQKKEEGYIWVIPYCESLKKGYSAKYFIKDRLRGTIFGCVEPDTRSIILINVARVIGFLDHIFTRDELKFALKRADELLKSDEISKAVIDLIDEIISATAADVLESSIL